MVTTRSRAKAGVADMPTNGEHKPATQKNGKHIVIVDDKLKQSAKTIAVGVVALVGEPHEAFG